MKTTDISPFLRPSHAVLKPISLRLPHASHEALAILLTTLAEREIHVSRHELLVVCLQEGLQILLTRLAASTETAFPTETE